MALTLTLRSETHFPLEVFGIDTQAVAGLSLAAIERLPLLAGRHTAPLAEFFTVAGSATDDHTLVWQGNLQQVKGIAARQTCGHVRVIGSAGLHLAAEMMGGTVLVEGSVSDWAGAEMYGGLLTIQGNAGRCLGGAYRGSLKGMRGGEILVHGHADDEAGALMRRGTLTIAGNAGQGVGFGMLAGTIAVGGTTGRLVAAGMKRGSVILRQPCESLLPSFRRSGIDAPVFVRLLIRRWQELGCTHFDSLLDQPLQRYCGDFTELGRGEIWMPATH
ncbi:formylmethanofuran dehydrogenase subunit C [bacterium]|nr:formylmethanofuran dehydrogenase subunit C [bacterium]